jgi:hypothetical protein
MPISTKVHRVMAIITKSGEMEMAEWIALSESGYAHFEQSLSSESLQRIADTLEKLDAMQQQIDFEPSYDEDTYFKPYRLNLRFHGKETDVGVWSPPRNFFVDHQIPDDVRQRFEDSFEEVLAILPKELREFAHFP